MMEIMEITYCQDQSKVPKLVHLSPMNKPFTPLIQFRNGFEEFSDFQIQCGILTFDCHKIILSARSNVFKALIASKAFTEAENNKLIIKDCECETFGHFLSFLYFNKYNDEKANPWKLLPLADKYEVLDLVKICETKIMKGLNLDNVCQSLILAHLHDQQELKKRCISFAMEKKREIVNCPQWNILEKNFPILISEILQNVSNIQSNIQGGNSRFGQR